MEIVMGGLLHLHLLQQLEILNERLSKDLTIHFILLLRPHLTNSRRTAVPVEIKIIVLTALTFFGHGSYQKCVAQNLILALHQSTVSKIIAQVSDAIVNHLMQRTVTFPRTDTERNALRQRFFNEFSFPGVIGAIDSMHVAIITPQTDDPVRPRIAYYNRKRFYSINFQMTCGADLQILNCNACFPGATHDSAIWELSSGKRYLEKYNNNEMQSVWLIGDAGYPLQPWLLTPVPDAQEGSPENRYNNAHIAAHNCIERCFGVLKQRFRCLLKDRCLHYNPVRGGGKIIYSCAVLHNLAVRNRLPVPEDDIQNA